MMGQSIWPRILLLGKNGQVGWELQRTLAPLGQVIALDQSDLDLTCPDQIRGKVREIKPNVIVNAAAYTAVDRAEEEPELAMAINGIAPGILAEEAKRINAGIVHYSTDYVFDGFKKSPYTEEDTPNPLNVYGKTKLAGGRAIQAVGVPHLIFRTSWVYGLRGKNFLLTIMRLAREKKELRIVDDQIGAPTWCRMIAESTALILAQGQSSVSDKRGIYNLTAGGQTSWYGFAREILDSQDTINTQLLPIHSDEYPTLAIRPVNSLLLTERISLVFGLKLPPWDFLFSLI
jgi:dTDP-4-dehydrorhamnose reductase